MDCTIDSITGDEYNSIWEDVLLMKGQPLSKGQLEAKICEAFSRFETDYMGRGPRQIKAYILQDMIIIRMMGFLSPSERKLAETPQGVEQIKKLRAMLFENAKADIEAMILPIINAEIASIHSDVSTKSGEKIIIITLGSNLEECSEDARQTRRKVSKPVESKPIR